MNAQDFDGWTPLHAAAHWGQKEACEILVENFCDMDKKNYVVMFREYSYGVRLLFLCSYFTTSEYARIEFLCGSCLGTDRIRRIRRGDGAVARRIKKETVIVAKRKIRYKCYNEYERDAFSEEKVRCLVTRTVFNAFREQTNNSAWK